jgi:hypothetical protein
MLGCTNESKQQLSKFDGLFKRITKKLDESLTEKYWKMTYIDAVHLYDEMISTGGEKEFINLLLIQARRNVSEVKGHPSITLGITGTIVPINCVKSVRY